MISFYSPQMVATVNITKYTIENDLTIKEKKKKNKKKNKHKFVPQMKSWVRQRYCPQ